MPITRRNLLAYSAGGLITGPLTPGVSAQSASPLLPDKLELRLLNDRPLNAETPAHLLHDHTTPASRLFVRNNGNPPVGTDVLAWHLQVEGESCVRPMQFSIAQLKSLFDQHSYELQLECGGNGRSEFRPRASGNQWTTGAVGCARWRGVRLRDVLEYCGIKNDAVYLAYEGADTHLSGDPNKLVISRGVPMQKALEAETLLAFELNGAPIPLLHGAPLRLVCGGWPASASGKWVTKLLIRNKVHDGPKMLGKSYRVPCNSVAPGAKVEDSDMCIIESMPVKSLITSPRSGISVQGKTKVQIGGKAWAGDLAVQSVAISTDYGATWRPAELAQPVNRLAWQPWQATVHFERSGFYEVWAKATDAAGRSQPMLVPGWNPKGYLNNACHRIALQVV